MGVAHLLCTQLFLHKHNTSNILLHVHIYYTITIHDKRHVPVVGWLFVWRMVRECTTHGSWCLDLSCGVAQACLQGTHQSEGGGGEELQTRKGPLYNTSIATERLDNRLTVISS